MRIQKLLFGTTLLLVTLLALANLSSLFISSAIYLPLLGVFQLPLMLIGLLGVTFTALTFLWAAKSSFTQAQASRVKDLEQLIDLQRVLDLRSKQERSNLHTALDAHANAIMVRLETLRNGEKFIPSSSNISSHPALEEILSSSHNRESLPLQNNSLNLR
jgi:hypothetical protein